MRTTSIALGATLMLLLGSAMAEPVIAADGTAAGPDNAHTLHTQALAPDHVPVWIATFMRSHTGLAIQSATVISLTNQGTEACPTSVDWLSAPGGSLCTTEFTLDPGQTIEHSSRSLPFSIVVCNATCSPELLALSEGRAVVGMKSSCKSKIAAYPRVYYTSSGDAAVQGVADAKLVKTGKANSGD